MTPTIRVVGGGEPSDEQLAAMSIALDALLAADEAVVAVEHRTPGWVIAALREGVGGPLVTGPPAPERY